MAFDDVMHNPCRRSRSLRVLWCEARASPRASTYPPPAVSLSECLLIYEQVSRSISSWLPSLEGVSRSRSAFVPPSPFPLYFCLQGANSLSPAFLQSGTAEVAQLVQSWAASRAGSGFTAAEAQARAVTEQGVEEIAAQVGWEGSSCAVWGANVTCDAVCCGG